MRYHPPWELQAVWLQRRQAVWLQRSAAAAKRANGNAGARSKSAVGARSAAIAAEAAATHSGISARRASALAVSLAQKSLMRRWTDMMLGTNVSCRIAASARGASARNANPTCILRASTISTAHASTRSSPAKPAGARRSEGKRRPGYGVICATSPLTLIVGGRAMIAAPAFHGAETVTVSMIAVCYMTERSVALARRGGWKRGWRR